MPGRRSFRSAGFGAVAWATLAVGAHAAGLSHDVHVGNPRAFGHFVGDVLERRIELTTPPGYALAADGLPKLERATPWLALIAARAQPAQRGDGTRYVIVLTYQIVNSPLQSRLTSLPAIALPFVGSGQPFDEGFDEWPITLSPLAAEVIRTGLEELRPSRAPRPIDVTQAAALLAASTSVAVILLVWLAALRFGRPVFGARDRPFAAAHRQLRALSREAAGTQRTRTALRALHRAFDATAGRRLFGEQLAAFMAAHAQFAGLQEPAAKFFAASRAEFFGTAPAPAPAAAAATATGAGAGTGATDGPELVWLLEVCARFKACERGPAGKRVHAV